MYTGLRLKKNYYYWLLVVLVLIYLATIFILKPNSATLTHYNISPNQLRMLSLAIIIPSVIIWFAAFYGWVNISKYAGKIKNSHDGKGFSYLAAGSIVLGVSMPIVGLISRLLTYLAEQQIITQALATIINTHITVLYTLVGFTLLFMGARHLLATIKKAQVPKSHTIGVAVVLVLISVPYIIATLVNPSRAVPTGPAMTATYYMSDPWILATIVLPYILVWIFGFYAALYLHAYYQNVRGKLYRKSLMKLTVGFFVVILSTIFLQFLTAASSMIYGWSVGAVMLIVYMLIFIIAVGYVYVALGAKGLVKLEEVT